MLGESSCAGGTESGSCQMRESPDSEILIIEAALVEILKLKSTADGNGIETLDLWNMKLYFEAEMSRRILGKA